jgi:flagellar basal body-associated protein FliL
MQGGTKMTQRAHRFRENYILVTLAISIVLLVAGCGIKASTINAKAGPVVGSTPVVTSESKAQPQPSQNSGIQWPSAMPADVPQFTYGTITGANNNVMGKVQATFSNVSSDAFNKYQSDLKDAGWKITSAAPDQSEIDAAKSSHSIVLMFLNSAKNGLKVTLTYNPKGGK